MSSWSDTFVGGLTGFMSHGSDTTGAGAAKHRDRGHDDDDAPDLVFANFNQDATSLSVGTTAGYRLYALNSCDSLEPIYENGSDVVYIAERLFSSSLVALVSQAAPRKLRVCHFKKGTEICNYSYTGKIISVKMNRARLVVCLEESLYIHNIRDMKVLHTIGDTPPNRAGLCALSTDADHCYLAYPAHSSVGELQIFDALNLSCKIMISAHTSQLQAMQFSPSGLRIATASEKGTVIRVFSVSDGSRLYELRRGLKRTVNIYSLAFSPCGHFLACSSNTETVHVFRMEEKPREREVMSQSPPQPLSADGWLGYMGKMVSASASYLPSQVTETLLQERAFATVRHTQSGMKNICALAMIKKSLRLLIVSQDGVLFMYSLNLEDGGDCSLIKQFRLLSANGDCGAACEIDSGVGATPEGSPQPSSSVVASEGAVAAAVAKMRITPEDSEKFHEMVSATESPPQQCFLLDDDGEFPPMISAMMHHE